MPADANEADSTERVLRGLYSAALYLLLPITIYHLIWRSFRQGEYLQRWNERYAAYGGLPAHDATIWVHAVSVGEVNAAAPLVNKLLALRPGVRLLVTSITPTGSARIRALWGERVEHVYLPYDLPGAVSRFLRHYRPRVALVLETELWPNLMFGCRDHGIPAWIVNARLSERSLRGYRLLRPLLRRALHTLRGVLAQSSGDAARFVDLGADPAATRDVGNLKYDIAPFEGAEAFTAEFRARVGERPVWIAASTHADEEQAVVALHRRLRERWPDLLLLWAARHPERFRAVAQQSVEAGWRVATRKLTQWPDDQDGVFVIDTLGELVPFYGCADVAFVGGSLQDIGGHNLLEPAAAGTAVVTGPHLHNFVDIAARLRAAGALLVGNDVDEVGHHLAALLDDAALRKRMVVAGQALVEEGRGALNRTLDLVAADLPPP
ncbi:lipid IV(A) 3-deoxy-D-manno-octulosonic acid transferase [Luteimonas sp. 8-5]|uniref:lipid IV(A) 3-deoxy-D-manno-octulosonic acid transferase n=1 Tax=Luteimonas sp. 8-5 TaxID=3039387 RepID=UPI0024370305|nr:lipid IV(A) 3-deoxy-D-manno-octulosonic acid transferase [Luteimonas sp. 8-5]MDG6348160.1 lipid IV(A) 3-deoxy-D-manno-octulosonic acid transferase [Luteimonas sp. 8-5]